MFEWITFCDQQLLSCPSDDSLNFIVPHASSLHCALLSTSQVTVSLHLLLFSLSCELHVSLLFSLSYSILLFGLSLALSLCLFLFFSFIHSCLSLTAYFTVATEGTLEWMISWMLMFSGERQCLYAFVILPFTFARMSGWCDRFDSRLFSPV